MSKNFELLQHAGWGQEYFETNEPRVKTISEARNEKAKDTGNERFGRTAEVPVEAKTPPKIETQAPLLPTQHGRNDLGYLVQSVFLAPGVKAPTVVMFSGLTPSSGSGWLCARIAKILARHTGRSVCVVDTNFHEPSLHLHFRQQNTVGLSDALQSGAQVKSFAKAVNGNNLWLLTAGNGAANSFAQLANPALPTRLSQLRSEFAHVLIDSPPLDGSRGTASFGHLVDGVILVLAASGTPREVALRAKLVVESTNAPVIGVVLNRKSDSFLDWCSRILK